MPPGDHQRQLHVAVLGFPAFSHALPLFNLTLKLAKGAPKVYFSYFNSARFISKVILSSQRQLIPANLETYIVEDGLAPDSNSKRILGEEVYAYDFFLSAMPGNAKRGLGVSMIERGRRITCIVADLFFALPTRTLAEEMEVPWAAFCVDAPHFLSAGLNVEELERVYVKNSEKAAAVDMSLEAIPGFFPLRMGDIPAPFSPCQELEGVYHTIDALFKMRFHLPQASVVVLCSYQELTPAPLRDDFGSKLRETLYVGCLTTNNHRSSSVDDDATVCLSWLDEQEEASVVYASFGSVAPLPCEEIGELAQALEDFGSPFIWSLRDELRKCLPSGFLERTSKQGKVVPWTPQEQVLCHPSTGVHVTHCGYNAVFESIFGGLPMICKPIWADNHINARMVEQVWGIGVRLGAGGMVDCLRTVFHEERGKEMREAAVKVREVLIEASGQSGSASADFQRLLQIVSE